MTFSRTVCAFFTGVLLIGPVSTAGAGNAYYRAYVAADGETNNLTLSDTQLGGRTWRWIDLGAIVNAQVPDCITEDEHRALCHPYEPRNFESCEFSVIPRGGSGARCPEGVIALGDQEDRFRLESASLAWYIDGGAGGDDLEGSWMMRGGPGDDLIRAFPRFAEIAEVTQLSGDAGRDRVFGTQREDVIEAQEYRMVEVEPWDTPLFQLTPESDRIDCGAGDDLVAADRSDRVGANCERAVFADQHAYLCPEDRFAEDPALWGLRVRVKPGGVLSSTDITGKRIGRARRQARRVGCSLNVTHRDGEPISESREQPGDDPPDSDKQTIEVDVNSETRRIRYVLGQPNVFSGLFVPWEFGQ